MTEMEGWNGQETQRHFSFLDDYEVMIAERRGAFTVNVENKHPVFVELQNDRFRISSVTAEALVNNEFLLYGRKQILRTIAELSVAGSYWDAEVGNLCPLEVRRIECAIGSSVASQLRSLRARVPRSILTVNKAVWRVTHGAGWLPPYRLLEPIYGDPQIVEEIARYEWAAIALINIVQLTRELFQRSFERNGAKAIAREAQRSGLTFSYTLDVAHNCHPEVRDAMKEWPKLFSDTAKPYRHLMETLWKGPRIGHPRLPSLLARVHLERPIIDPVELATLLLGLEYVDFSRTRPEASCPDLIRILLGSSRREITQAIERLSRSVGRRLSTSLNDLAFVVSWIGEYPEAHSGRLNGLAEKSIGWHSEHVADSCRDLIHSLGGLDTPTCRPPIPLPVAPGIQFISNLRALKREGQSMNHCLATTPAYIERAYRGDSFYFHVRNGNEHATAEVNRDGTLGDIVGPRNQESNAAVLYGRRVLGRWAEDLCRLTSDDSDPRSEDFL